MWNSYYKPTTNTNFSIEDLQDNYHRLSVGGIWEEQGNLQLELCKKIGLKPNMKMLDFGCGCLRGGVKLINYLDKGNYFGMDLNSALLNAGLLYEIPRVNLEKKIVRDNFLISNKFEVDLFKTKFDLILAQSVFTHLTLNHFCYFLEKCLNSLTSDGVIAVTFWLIEESEDITKLKTFVCNDMEVETSLISDPFHYKLSQIQSVVEKNWDLRLLDVCHPRKQKTILLTKR